jgi:hypothetical protein
MIRQLLGTNHAKYSEGKELSTISADRINAWSIDKRALSTQSADKHNSTYTVKLIHLPQVILTPSYRLYRKMANLLR